MMDNNNDGAVALSPHAQSAVDAEQAAIESALTQAQLTYLGKRVHDLAVELAEAKNGCTCRTEDGEPT